MVEKVNELNRKISELCREERIEVINNSNLKDSHLSKRKLHLNQKGLSILANNVITFLNWKLTGTGIIDINRGIVSDSLETLYSHKRKHPKNVLLSFLNINSIRNKFESLKCILKVYVDILAIGESKLDESFPTSQFLIEGYANPYRLDINGCSGGLLVYVNENIPSRILTSFEFESDIQIIPVETNLRKVKWVVFSISTS